MNWKLRGLGKDMSEIDKKYYGVKVDKSISEDGEIFLYADYFDVINGYLIFRKNEIINFIIAKEKWSVVFEASILDGHPMNVEHWKEVKG